VGCLSIAQLHGSLQSKELDLATVYLSWLKLQSKELDLATVPVMVEASIKGLQERKPEHLVLGLKTI
jgi:ABC-type molybdate transport system substrate-binding protein